MIIVLKAGATGRGIALVGGKRPGALEGRECVEKAPRILKPYKIVSRDFQKEDTVITVRGQTIGGGTVALIAGPCAVEGREVMLGIGGRGASSGAAFLRGGAFKPR